MTIYVVMQCGGSDEILAGIFTTIKAAHMMVENTAGRYIIVEYDLDGEEFIHNGKMINFPPALYAPARQPLPLSKSATPQG